MTAYPDMTESVREKMETLRSTWKTTNDRIVVREGDLNNSKHFHQVVIEYDRIGVREGDLNNCNTSTR